MDARHLLRHSLAVVAYRGGKAIRNAPAEFAIFKISSTSRTPAEIVAHIGDLFEWALSIARGRQTWSNSPPAEWDHVIERFYSTLAAFDAYLASSEPIHATAEKLLQGPIADSLTHIGQLTMLRRLAGAPVRGESYYAAQIKTGEVGPNQPAPIKEFD
jgi:hypothetical protein